MPQSLSHVGAANTKALPSRSNLVIQIIKLTIIMLQIRGRANQLAKAMHSRFVILRGSRSSLHPYFIA